MIGIVPGTTKTYEIDGDFHCPTPIEGKLYYDPKTGRLYYFSTHIFYNSMVNQHFRTSFSSYDTSPFSFKDI